MGAAATSPTSRTGRIPCGKKGSISWEQFIALNLDWGTKLINEFKTNGDPERKHRFAADLIEFFGEDVIRRMLDGVRPGWEYDLRMSRERHVTQKTPATGPSPIQPRG